MLTLEYSLEPEDVRRGVRVLFAPSPLAVKSRKVLLGVVAVLWLVAGAMIAYLLFFLWRRPCAARSLVLGITAVWAALGGLSALVWRRPNCFLDLACDWTARRMIARSRPGPRRLTVSEDGVAVEAGGVRHVRAWSDFRRARRDEGHLVLAAKDLWFFIPLKAVPEAARAELIREAEARAAFTPVV